VIPLICILSLDFNVSSNDKLTSPQFKIRKR